MTLHKIKDFYPDYREQFGDHDLLSFSLYAGVNGDKVGSVDDLLVDDDGRFRYVIANTGAWIFGKKVLLPIGQTRFDYTEKRIYADNLSREQVENLPEYDPSTVLDYGYEERVRGVYRPSTSTATTSTGFGATTGLGATAGLANQPLESSQPLEQDVAAVGYSRDYGTTAGQDAYRYDYDPDLYDLGERNQTLKLYEERLIAGKTRQKTGDVAIGKHVETETQRVSVPVEKERVVIERVNPTGVSTVTPGVDAFQEGEVVRVEVYEETPEIRKETFVREEVRVRKETETNTVETNETIRKERLDIDHDGNTSVREQ